MQLLTGPAGSGKTSFLLERLREALGAGCSSVRLLVPTSTMARHLQNRIAREGFVLRHELIQTLSGFIDRGFSGDGLVNDPSRGPLQPSDPTFFLLVEQAVQRAGRREFARVAGLPGFCASIAHTISEFSSAGCSSDRLAARLPDAPLAAAFLAVYREVDRELERRGMALRSRRLELAAARIESQGLGEISAIWLDGFHALPDPELGVLAALDRHAEVTLALTGFDATAHVRGALHITGETAFARRRSNPAVALFQAPTMEREASEIARRILEQAASGRPFREMGVIVRADDAYVPVLRTTLARYAIPARFYFDEPLDRHAAVRFLSNAMDAMLAGWDHATTLAALRLAPRFADSIAMDRFDFAVREQIPNTGLGGLKALLVGPEGQPSSTGDARLLRKIERLAAIEEWRSFALAPRDWAARLRSLRPLFRAARPGDEPLTHEVALEWRSQAAALDLFEEALDEAAGALDPAGLLPLQEFWPAVQSVLRLKPLRLTDHRLADNRRDVVHVLSAPEAREWELPIVFVCGMTEKQFPQIHPQDPFFPEEARRELQSSGIRVRTAADFEREERVLFESALSRATMQVVLSYPELGRRGEAALPSLYLEDLSGVGVPACPVEIIAQSQGAPLAPSQGATLAASEASRAERNTLRDRHPANFPALKSDSLAPADPHTPEAPPPGEPCTALPQLPPIHSPSLLNILHNKTVQISPTSLELYLQCPFKYFSGRTLRLEGPPLRPEQRLDFITQGNIIHQTLAEWYANPQEIAALFDRVFGSTVEQNRIPSGYHTERLRNAMLEDLHAFIQDPRWPRAAFHSQTEQTFEFPLDGLLVRGKIDRLDTSADGRAWIIDYKYSAPPGVRRRLDDANLLQAPLYLMAAERFFHVRPAGMFYIGLKKGVTYAGWGEEQIADLAASPIPEGWLADAAARTLRAVAEIRAGRVEAAPANPENCRLCDYGDICRVPFTEAARGRTEAA